MNAADVKTRLRGRHPGSGGQMPGPWTCIEEWCGIDLLAFSAWSSQENYARVGYEVKVSRSDMRTELRNPGKRARNVAWCNSFYFAVPSGLLTPEELAFDEPEWSDEDFVRDRCPAHCRRPPLGLRAEFKGTATYEHVSCSIRYRHDEHGYRPCEVCGGVGYLAKSRVELEAPTLWVPRDVGLVEVHDSGATRIVKKSPRRREVPSLSAAELGQLVRYVSIRPDPRHLNDPRRVSREKEVAAC